MKTPSLPLKVAFSTLIGSGLALSAQQASANPFAISELDSGYIQLSEAEQAKSANKPAAEGTLTTDKENCEMTCGATMNDSKGAKEMVCGAMKEGKMDTANHEAMKQKCHEKADPKATK